MKNIIKPTLILLLICVISSAILSVLYSNTKPIIEQNQKENIENARKAVLPDAVKDKFVAVDVNNVEEGEERFIRDSIMFYKGYNEDGKLVGFTFQTAGQGYSSSAEVKTMVGIDLNMKIEKITIIQQQETPGLGANCVNPEFTRRFTEKDPAGIKVDKDGGNIESITGATITTRAVTNSIRDKFVELQDDFKKQMQGGGK
ncbi:MAG: RnfABCDGE type electron transport complex subunit G [Candidatus Cloacimonetes bacterium]|nr:RnfABCDGE type electron transport complex subunit G [Candidatus Cloacimonadota bacterium]MBS3767344.1 RnfABCDGE type electron transport complex subunit G [Candidatus Cloacimonadota bacterium]